VATRRVPLPVAATCCASVLEPDLDEADAIELARAFAALGDPVRLRVLNLIATAGEICSCDLLEPLGKAQPTISHHTKALADAGLIAGEKRGRWVWWSVVPERLDAIRDALGR
jgi:ArsR family transcriptional regulator, arsenate/arsenite/antimonite-responsive transcriptional repressor